MQSNVAAGKNLDDAITLAMRYVPGDSETARAVEFILQSHRTGVAEWDCWKELLSRHGNENFTHAPLNVALTIWALWYGAGDFEKSILMAVNGGYDTDCTAATVGATLGLLLGRAGIPARWIEPIGEEVFVGLGIQGIDEPKTLTELTGRTVALIGKLDPKTWDGAICVLQTPPPVNLEALPGTLRLLPADGGQSVAWANGELPSSIKQAGGARWTWHVTTGEPREIICLAREGARLFLDDKLIGEFPSGLPYVPATHRCPKGSRVRVTPGAGTHEVRLELHSTGPEQEVSVILAYPNFHICPWTKDELPHVAKLPDT